MRLLLLAAVTFASLNASAQVYRWVDDKGRVHYSSEAPPAGANASVLNIDAQPGPEGERTKPATAPRDVRPAAEPVAASLPPPVRGLDFRKYVSIQRGMSEGELLGIAGEADLRVRNSKSSVTYTYMPTPGDPFTTTIRLERGRVSEIDRVRRF